MNIRYPLYEGVYRILTPKSQGKYSIDSQISTDYCKRIIGDRVSEVDDFLAVSFFFLAMNK